MAKEFDFKKGKKQTAFKTPMLTSKVSPGKARLAGKAAAEKVRNPQGNSYGFDAGALSLALPLGKLIKAAQGFRAAGKASKAAGLEARVLAKTEGRAIRSQVEDLQGGGDFGPTMKSLRRTRLLSENVYPKISDYGDAGTFNRYGDMLPKATRKARGIKRVNPQAD